MEDDQIDASTGSTVTGSSKGQFDNQFNKFVRTSVSSSVGETRVTNEWKNRKNNNSEF